MKTWNALWASLVRQSARVPWWALLLALFSLIVVACAGDPFPPQNPQGPP
jgi:hypothetical protein